ncbi:MAG: TMEM175 family protein [Mucilaginibacter sp.]
MGKGRLEAFSDGVIAIIITIMVLEMHAPAGHDLQSLIAIGPVFGQYVISFVYVGIYWSNHHHMLHAVKSINGAVLWANLHLLFWLSMVPFASAWMGENHTHNTWPVAFYGFVLLMNSIAYFILAQTLVRHEGKHSALAEALGKDKKGKISTLIYICAIPLCWVNPLISFGLYILVALIWLVPDKRIEQKILHEHK